MPGELWRTHGLEVSRDADGAIVTSGAMSYWADEPVSSYAVGDTFRPVGAQGPALKVTRVSISDEVIGTRMGKPVRQWHIEVESDGTVTGGGDETTRARWTFEKSKDDDGLTHMSGSVELIIDGDDPSPFSMELGDTFGSKLTDVPIEDMKSLKCTRVSASDEWTDKGVRRWTVTYDGAKVAPASGDILVPTDTEETISYEINGRTTRAVDGTFVVLKRSSSPVERRSLVRYWEEESGGKNKTTLGSAYEELGIELGIVVSERVTKETIKENGVVIGSYWRHDIEVEK